MIGNATKSNGIVMRKTVDLLNSVNDLSKNIPEDELLIQ